MIQVRLVLKLFLLMGVGAFLRKRKMITEEGKLLLTDLIIKVVMPCHILSSFLSEEGVQGQGEPMQIFLISLGIQIGSWLLSLVIYRPCNPAHREVLRYGTICSNSGILGIPVATELLGVSSMLLASLYLLPLRIAIWTIGVAMFTGNQKSRSVKDLITHPCIVATLLGLVLMLADFTLPAVLSESISLIAAGNTFLCLLLVGCTIADMDRKLLFHKDAIYFTCIRLVGLPLFVLLICSLLHISGMVRSVAVLLTAMPAGATTAILALKYDKAPGFAAACTSLSTLVSLIAIPVWYYFLQV